MDEAELPEREQQSLAEQMALPIEATSKDDGPIVNSLKEKGARLYANVTTMLLDKIASEKN